MMKGIGSSLAKNTFNKGGVLFPSPRMHETYLLCGPLVHRGLYPRYLYFLKWLKKTMKSRMLRTIPDFTNWVLIFESPFLNLGEGTGMGHTRGSSQRLGREDKRCQVLRTLTGFVSRCASEPRNEIKRAGVQLPGSAKAKKEVIYCTS